MERPVVKKARDQGWKVYKLAFLGTNGAPDRLFGKGKRAVFIEFKSARGVLSEQQRRRHAELRDQCGFEVHTCRTIEEASEILDLL